MKKNLKYVQWLVFWLSTCLPFAIMAAEVAVATTAAPLPPAQDFPFAEPEFETLHDAETIDDQAITTLAQDARGLIWIGTPVGLIRYDGYRFRKFTYKAADPFSLGDDYVTSLSVAKDGRIWVGTLNAGISVFDPASEHFKHFRHDEKAPNSLSDGRISAMAHDGRGGMWVATEQGPDHLPNGSRYLVHFKHGLAPRSLMDDKVRSLLLNKEGRLWVGSRRGLQRPSPDGKTFETVVVGRDVLTLFQAQDGKLWLGTHDHGTAWLMPSGVRASASQSSVAPALINWLPLAQLSHPWIAGIAQVKTDQIWLASYGGGIIVVAASDGRVLQTLHHDPGLMGSLVPDTVKPLLPDRAGWLWVGTWGGRLATMNGNNTLLRVLRHSAKRPSGLSHPDVRSMLELADGHLAFGTGSNGIDIFDKQRGLIGGYRIGQGQPAALPDTAILALAQTSDGSIRAGTHQAGVVRQFPGSSAWVAVPGLPNKQVFGLLASRDGSLWAGTTRGVARWRPGVPQPQFRTSLTQADGMDLGGTWVGSYGQTHDGLLLFGGTQGVAIIDPARFKAYDYAPPLAVTALKINGETVAPGVLANPLANPSPQAGAGNAASLTLLPAQRNFAIEFAALDYSEPKKNRYPYRLQGYEKNWINTDADHRSAAYGNLWPGLYTLQVRGSNRLGEWSNQELSIPIRVLPAWWQTWWFALALLLLMTSLVAALVQGRTRYLRQRQRELEQLVNERTGQLRQKQEDLIDANHGLNESNAALNEANTDLALSVETLRQLGDIGREITANLDAEIVFKALYLYVGDLLDAPTMTIYRMNASAKSLDAVFGRDDDQVMSMRNIALDSPTSNAARAVRERQDLLLHFDPQDDSTTIPGTRQMLTALFAPLIVGDKVLGAMSIQSDKPNA